MKKYAYYLITLGLVFLNIQCSDNTDYGYVKDPTKSGTKNPDNSPNNSPPYYWWPNATLVVQSIDSFGGNSEYEFLKTSFLGDSQPMVRDSTGSHPANPDYIPADTIPAYIDGPSDYMSVSPVRPGIFGKEVWNWDTATENFISWELKYRRTGKTFKISGISTGEIFTSCPDSSEDTSEYCTFEFEGKEVDVVNTLYTYVGIYKWAQVSSGSRCDLFCSGKMTLVFFADE